MRFDLEQARAMLLRGASVGSIAKKFRMTAGQLYWAMSANGCPVGDLKAARKQAIAHDLAQGMPIGDVVKKFGCSTAYAKNALLENPVDSAAHDA